MFKKEQSIGIRIWHWGNAAAMCLLFATVILRKTFLGRANKTIILTKAQEIGVQLTDSQAGEFARAIRNQMWQWHPIIGFVAIALLAYRALIYFQNRANKIDVSTKPLQYKIVKMSHKLFYFFLAVMGITGGAMYWDEALHLSKESTHNIQNVHETLQWFFVLFVISHIVGVVKAEFGEDKGLISDMINGGANSSDKKR